MHHLGRSADAYLEAVEFLGGGTAWAACSERMGYGAERMAI